MPANHSFIELHLVGADRRPVLINLARVTEIKPDTRGQGTTLIDFGEPDSITQVNESYEEVRRLIGMTGP